ncbi:hypothetical protein Cyagr_0289 [Cyanobium gracile PCC 6307]|uniref:Uncharacterized protein n=2 Tax=Cyanobium gracile TaxID=59930 RepID=K9P3D7_CYAGP|nr:hypothetical protein Cyagr_0289 [Cyanobium gracile PCC 6307]
MLLCVAGRFSTPSVERMSRSQAQDTTGSSVRKFPFSLGGGRLRPSSTVPAQGKSDSFMLQLVDDRPGVGALGGKATRAQSAANTGMMSNPSLLRSLHNQSLLPVQQLPVSDSIGDGRQKPSHQWAAAISERISSSTHPNGYRALTAERTFARMSGSRSMVLPTGITTLHPEQEGDVQPPHRHQGSLAPPTPVEQMNKSLLSTISTLAITVAPISAVAQSVPITVGMNYGIARQRLIQAGWQPLRSAYPAANWIYKSAENSSYNHLEAQTRLASYFRQRGWYETLDCAPTGHGMCGQQFFNAKGKGLIVTTTNGEVSPPIVKDYTFGNGTR